VDFLIIGKGMFGSAIARHLAPHATVTVVGPGAVADGSRGHGAHYDEGRIIGDASRDLIWSELNRRARHGMTELDPGLITLCGAVTATTRDDAGGRAVAPGVLDRSGAAVRMLTPDEARASFPMTRFGLDETILYQPADRGPGPGRPLGIRPSPGRFPPRARRRPLARPDPAPRPGQVAPARLHPGDS
jgi:glycine/D-amino acid oxidase-like deaminating enzyme